MPDHSDRRSLRAISRRRFAAGVSAAGLIAAVTPCKLARAQAASLKVGVLLPRPTAPMILADAFSNQKEIFEATGAAPKSVVFMHVNDTFGTSMQQAITGVLPKFNMPYKVADQIAYDPTARDLSVEVAKAKATGA